MMFKHQTKEKKQSREVSALYLICFCSLLLFWQADALETVQLQFRQRSISGQSIYNAKIQITIIGQEAQHLLPEKCLE